MGAGDYFCRTCAIGFRIGARPKASAVAKCGQCGLLTWHAEATAGPRKRSYGVTVGVTAEELAQHRAAGSERALEAAP